MSIIMGWFTILITALFAKWLKNYMAAIMVVLLYAVSPFFIGHSYNNLKDIPFAFAYISGIWFTIKFISKSGKVIINDAVFLTLSIAFCISIRAGGLILICYLFMFLFIYYLIRYLKYKKVNYKEIIRKLAWIFAISLLAFLMSSLLWPYALQDPLRNIIDSYRLMAHYPATFRQLFEGTMEWSDYMPWYYLLKSMVITIPLVVLIGFLIFLTFFKSILKDKLLLQYSFLLFTLVFPLFFVMIEKSNLYSSWRQFLFVYPVIIILASAGLVNLFTSMKNRIPVILVAVFIALLTIHPLRFMIRNHPYEYVYYNELAGGVKGAYSNYELDYYYTSQTEAAEWLINHLDENGISGPVKVAAAFSVDWQFRNNPEVETSWFRFEERSMHDWDYAIVVNRYIPPFQLKNKIWPPDNTIHTILVDDAPVCAIVERRTKDDFLGYRALSEGNYKDAAEYFRRVLTVNVSDEMIFYNFAGALYKLEEFSKADSVLKKGLEINPDSEPVLMYLGNIAKAKGMTEDAMKYYQKVIGVNRKYSEAYVNLAEILKPTDILKARKLLRDCLTINPQYKPAIIALGDTYKGSNPEIAKKYYEQAKKLN
jgi:tetratricopeptide (TPR) repeat protein